MADWIMVTGGRDLSPWIVSIELESRQPDVVVDGGCPTGADAAARVWCKAHGKTSITCYAPWQLMGKRAGPWRNSQMVNDWHQQCAYLLSFPGGTGTADCTAKAENIGMRVVRVTEWGTKSVAPGLVIDDDE